MNFKSAANKSVLKETVSQDYLPPNYFFFKKIDLGRIKTGETILQKCFDFADISAKIVCQRLC